MSILRLLLREIQFRKLNFALGLVSVVAAVALPVAVLTMCEAADREITRLMRNMGFNLLIMPRETDMADFWSEQYSDKDMPEEYVRQLGEFTRLQVRHLVARLQKKVEWRGRKVLLTGVLPEISVQSAAKKSRMDNDVPEGKADIGYELWKSQGFSPGDTVTLDYEGRTREFEVDECWPEQGSIDDIRLSLHLHDAQELLGLPGRITDIQALSCYCKESILDQLRAGLAKELPDTQITELRSQALTRAETRAVVERYAAFTVPLVLLICAVWVGMLALSNVRERRAEIGVLRAMGVGSARIGALFIGKAIVLGLLGAAIGYPIGTWVAVTYGPNVFPVTAAKITPVIAYLYYALVGAPLLCALAAYLPAVVAMTQDPAVVLRDE